MADCPNCKGTGKQSVLAARDGKPIFVEVPCGFCGGTGKLESVPFTPPSPKPATPPPPLETWPFLLPLGLFALFFLFLWL